MSAVMPIADAEQRRAAIDPDRSFIVQAPAGSGKTELLIQRFLALLGSVERPQQILAITFTRKAAAEMRIRLLDALVSAQQDSPEEAHKKKTWQLARDAMEQDRKQGWELLQNPSLLSIQTIDSFNAGLVNKMPWLSRFGGVPELAEDADTLYQQAAENLLQRFMRGQQGSDQIGRLLTHLDNRMDRLQQMLVDMLSKRDQWLRHLLGVRGEESRQPLESALENLVADKLQQLSAACPAECKEEILFCGRYAAAQLWDKGERPILTLTDLDWMPQAVVEHLPIWQGVADLLLTSGGDLRKPRGINKNCGFPTGDGHKDAKIRMQSLLDELESSPAFISLLSACRELPRAEYIAEQWQILQALIELLPLLVAELWLVFRAEGQADFAEIALKAKEALASATDPSDLLLKLDSQLEHILVDEFQDTSWLQYQLLETLTSGWQQGDGRTLFLVGDPMQSIYRFREAEVGLFLKTFAGRLGDDGTQLEPLRLSCNFRSQQGIVDWVNCSFAGVFPAKVDVASGAVPLAEADAVLPPLPGGACELHAFNGRDDLAEAEQVLQLVRQAQQDDPQQTVAILVRSRTHLPQILQLLRQQQIPFQAQDIDLLGEQPVALDIISLTRALLHRGDRLAWLSVLRAPWAALSLHDLHALVADAPYATLPSLLQDEQRLASLSDEGRQHLARIWPILQTAIDKRGRFGLRQLVEGCWLALGGAACYSAEALDNAALVFDLLERLEEGSDLPALDLLEKGLSQLFSAADSTADGRLQVMTIHKAKGLEFDQVILPGLGRRPRGADSPLLRWLEHPEHGLLLAPIAPRDGSEQDPIYRLIGKLEQEKQQLETGRLLYVAATRARQRLHLFGHAKENSRGELKPEKDSLLETLWPVLGEQFGVCAVVSPEAEPQMMQLALKRLPLYWQHPELQAAPLPQTIDVGRASDLEEFDNEDVPFSGWESQVQRHIGTIVHNQLEQLVKQGAESWRPDAADQRSEAFSRQLAVMGVPVAEHDSAIATIMSAVENTLQGQKGRWLLQPHTESACELPLTGVVDGALLHCVIDRTFIDEHGVRWVIDYKVSAPKKTETHERFYAEKREQYRGQLLSYQLLLQQLEPGRKVRSALYFPLFDGWCEL
ncbi:ATP-dependent exoDNAse (exonuclease V) beta subunit (contains helicase and exonuclease domains) [Malonomonas rubra DSM 5091]|uniref:DNA 3'-5' helicase n=1 Tax=Malonomonas rubra DSM 5091 TaxID=1122189 RepID=A0A1M6DI60_MALRU|nr:UvrD-helicase domain-containing protein [Malonomonas rubra]SHI72698.1 ATP-dependent exoDNAse (exonuclease V) beta subunit (contains helicase and exonuclease domains) [Malonomonas rubra DSM 5091]